MFGVSYNKGLCNYFLVRNKTYCEYQDKEHKRKMFLKKKVVEVPLRAREEGEAIPLFLLKKEYINRNTVYIGYKDQIHKNNKALIRTVIMRDFIT